MIAKITIIEKCTTFATRNNIKTINLIKNFYTMKKVFFALAVVAMFSFVACNGNNTEATDTTAAEEQVMEPVDENACCADTTAVQELAEEATEVAE